MKKIIVLSLAFLLAFSLVGCRATADIETDAQTSVGPTDNTADDGMVDGNGSSDGIIDGNGFVKTGHINGGALCFLDFIKGKCHIGGGELVAVGKFYIITESKGVG